MRPPACGAPRSGAEPEGRGHGQAVGPGPASRRSEGCRTRVPAQPPPGVLSPSARGSPVRVRVRGGEQVPPLRVRPRVGKQLGQRRGALRGERASAVAQPIGAAAGAPRLPSPSPHPRGPRGCLGPGLQPPLLRGPGSSPGGGLHAPGHPAPTRPPTPASCAHLPSPGGRSGWGAGRRRRSEPCALSGHGTGAARVASRALRGP